MTLASIHPQARLLNSTLIRIFTTGVGQIQIRMQLVPQLEYHALLIVLELAYMLYHYWFVAVPLDNRVIMFVKYRLLSGNHPTSRFTNTICVNGLMLKCDLMVEVQPL